MMKELNAQGILETLQAMNRSLDVDNRLDEQALHDAFEAMWPRLERSLHDLESQSIDELSHTRKDRELLEEMLELLRGNLRTARDQSATSYTINNFQVLAEVLPRLLQITHAVKAQIPATGNVVEISTGLMEEEVSSEQRSELNSLKHKLQHVGIVLDIDWLPF
jgi:hypothetical protein